MDEHAKKKKDNKRKQTEAMRGSRARRTRRS